MKQKTFYIGTMLFICCAAWICALYSTEWRKNVNSDVLNHLEILLAVLMSIGGMTMIAATKPPRVG